MKAELLDEPKLQFGQGRHVDPRFGILELGPADAEAPAAPRTMNVGVVGTDETIDGVVRWLTRCRKPIPGRADARQPNLYPPFPGFVHGVGFDSELVFDQRHQRAIPTRALRELRAITDRNERVEAAASLLVDEVGAVTERALPQVVIVAPSVELLDIANDGGEKRQTQLHDILKARAMMHPVPLQYVRPATYDPTKARAQKKASSPSQLQDDATRAWNFHTALYYKAGGYPWALVRDASDLQTCFIGVSFYWENDHHDLATSLAQVFNERGEGVIIRGGPAKLSRGDRQPYLPHDDAEALLTEALAQYRSEHRHLPARVVIHKTSRFQQGEIDGFQAAADDSAVDTLELVAIGPSSTRFFTPRAAPPFRGTHIVLDEQSQLLYTSGSIPFYETYPGPYVPQPLGVSLQSPSGGRRHALELLALTKLNWNHSRLDGRDPITTLAARSIGSILRHVAPGAAIGNRYSFYM